MADFADKGSASEELARSMALLVRAPDGPAAWGKCLYCDEPLMVGKRWCNAECRDDWQAEQGSPR